MYLDAELYESTEPLNSVISFLRVTLKDLGWNDGKEHLVMDVGCGPGNVTVNWILPLFPNLKKIIALDYLPSMIELAKTKNFHPKTEYHVADFEDGSATEVWNGQITKLISIHCFNWFKNQEKALQIAYDLLQLGGEAALYFIVQSDYYDTVLDITNNSKWKSLFEGIDIHVPKSCYEKYNASHYRKIAEKIGFSVVLCQTDLKVNELPTHQDAKDLLFSICTLIPHIPESQKDEFKKEFYQSILEHGGITKDGAPVHRALTLELVLRKSK
ncbi:methyltransf_25 domain-containing protein [Trichonephila clavata]|uniref:Methyltransf_25 domain-containing protein n=1 Tax=Trichonephila clavata TaxID=2740835 RepID=A0A8X6KS95_TRICU|nr:methyltransf_25 domain-containing protein [Trichonephila clavata]